VEGETTSEGTTRGIRRERRRVKVEGARENLGKLFILARLISPPEAPGKEEERH